MKGRTRSKSCRHTLELAPVTLKAMSNGSMTRRTAMKMYGAIQNAADASLTFVTLSVVRAAAWSPPKYPVVALGILDTKTSSSRPRKNAVTFETTT
eukprot:CAMPEP_0118667092 /NCGR_PEP_ID=MMETSP0785-20121206/19590_1 /TAXON_ID=91992 /ORGANISM="Bolidomonas pacifica, Strain CCMP 1866" /LENGTH=95 /DNA_ID=CAMNT_0006561499 /DNA_START=241 /DNA_END=528 /DNA_ORIENTATION=-